LGIDDVQPPQLLLERLRCFDRILSWYGTNRPEFQEALRAINPNCVFWPALPKEGQGIHAADFYLHQVGAPLGSDPRIIVPANEPRGTVVIHPFSGGSKKNWPLPKFQALAQALALPVEWLAGPEEDLDGARQIQSLDALARWLTGARLYIGNDSGITHLAAALGIPVVALFGPTSPEIWGSRGDNVSILRNERIEQLEVEPVLRLVRRLTRS
jgi:hypothetical protein